MKKILSVLIYPFFYFKTTYKLTGSKPSETEKIKTEKGKFWKFKQKNEKSNY